jgi:hypothetical protein
MLPAGVFAIARLLGIDARRSLVAAIALAVDPVSLRIGATESYVTPVAALTAAASLAAAAAALHAARRDRWGAGSLALAAGCFCAQAARVHPAAWIPVAMAPLTAAGAPFVGVLRPWRSRVRRPFVARATLTLAVLGVAGAVVVLTSAADLMRPLEATLGGETLRASARPSGVDRGHALTFAIAIVLAIVLLARPRWPAVLAALGALAVLALGDNFLQSPLWHAAIDRFYAVPILVGAAALAPAPLARTRAFVPVAAAAVAFLAWRASPGAFSPPTTDDQEYRWARSWLQGLPRGCRVTYVGIAGRRNAFLPTYASSPPADARRLDGRQPIRMRDVLGDVGCTFYVRTSLCSTPEGRSACDGVERQLHLDPLARASLAAVPSSLYLPYDQPRLEVLAARVLAIEDDR